MFLRTERLEKAVERRGAEAQADDVGGAVGRDRRGIRPGRGDGDGDGDGGGGRDGQQQSEARQRPEAQELGRRGLRDRQQQSVEADEHGADAPAVRAALAEDAVAHGPEEGRHRSHRPWVHRLGAVSGRVESKLFSSRELRIGDTDLCSRSPLLNVCESSSQCMFGPKTVRL